MVSLDLLQAFVAVAEAGSFTGAARRLGLPKSSVSRSIAALESELDVGLIHRTTRRVALSTAGAALLERVAPLLAGLRASLGELPESDEQPAGVLRVTASNDFGAMVLAELCARFAARYPLISIDVRLTNAVVDIVAEGIDLAIRISSRRLADSSLSARRLGTIQLKLFASPAYLARRGTPRAPADLEAHEWIVFRHYGPLRLESTGCPPVAVRQAGRVTGDDMMFVHRAARGGAGIALLPTFLADDDVAAGSLVRVLPRWGARSGTMWLVTPSARHVPRKVVAFRDMLLAELGDRPR